MASTTSKGLDDEAERRPLGSRGTAESRVAALCSTHRRKPLEGCRLRTAVTPRAAPRGARPSTAPACSTHVGGRVPAAAGIDLAELHGGGEGGGYGMKG
jgi:hypothetical protein